MLQIAHCTQHAYLMYFIAFGDYISLPLLYSVYDFYNIYIKKVLKNCRTPQSNVKL